MATPIERNLETITRQDMTRATETALRTLTDNTLNKMKTLFFKDDLTPTMRKMILRGLILDWGEKDLTHHQAQEIVNLIEEILD